MKKFLSILLAVMLLLSVSSVAMADTTSYTDMTEVTITKNYQLIGAGSSPAETFTLQQTAKTKRTGETSDVPDLGTITGAQFNAGAASTTGATANITIALPRYTSVGVYEYTLREVATNQTAGVTYYGRDIYLVVTVINGENGNLRVAAVHTETKNSNGGFDSIVSGTSPKSDTFTNTYTAGSLKVKKTVDGILGDKTKEFTFTVTLSAPEGKNWTPAVTIKKNGTVDSTLSLTKVTDTNNYTFTTTLANDQSFEICNLPAGVTYTVSETEDTNYTTTINSTASTAANGKHSTNGTITVTTSESVNTVSYVNTRTGDVDTGVSLDSLPYLLMLAVAGAGLVLMIARKRRVQD